MAIVPFARNSVNKNQANAKADQRARQTRLNKLVGATCYLIDPTPGLPEFLKRRHPYRVTGWNANFPVDFIYITESPSKPSRCVRLDEVVFDFEGPR